MQTNVIRRECKKGTENVFSIKRNCYNRFPYLNQLLNFVFINGCINLELFFSQQHKTIEEFKNGL